ncbi:dehydrogenase/reductase SDR family member 7 [Sigmodon hispidus]
MSGEFWLWALCALLPALWLLSLFFVDSDLRLLWAEWMGQRPEQALTGMVVWVTGASSGIGEELALQLSKLGVSLVLSARRVQELERVKRRCLENGNVREKDILVLPLDLADRSSHNLATKTVLQEFGRIDILINNGGEAHCSFAVDTNMDVFKELIEVNYLGTVSLTMCVLPHMMKRKHGKIVIMNSIAGIVPVPLCSGYTASKHALRGFFNNLQAELFDYPGITVSTICAGPVHSNIFRNSFTSEITKTTGNDSEKVSKMPTSRCVQLMLITMANDLKEVWIANQPILFGIYVWQYVPIQDWIFSRKSWRKVVELYNIKVNDLLLFPSSMYSSCTITQSL